MNSGGAQVSRHRHWFWMAPLFVVFLFFLLGLGANAWLESSGGRNLLENSLTRNLGVPVSLQGAYRLSFLPRLAIDGTDLKVSGPGGQGMAWAETYSAAIELVPFLHRELRVTRIELGGGYFDVASLPGPVGSDNVMALPSVDFLQVRDFSVRFGSAAYRVDIGELQVNGFATGKPAEVAVSARIAESDADLFAAALEGRLSVEAGDLTTRLDIRNLQLGAGETWGDGISGQIQWSPGAGRLQAALAWQDERHEAGVSLDIGLGDAASGRIDGNFLDRGLDLPVSLLVQFTQSQQAINLDEVSLDIGGQRVDGGGCVRFSDVPVLNLEFTAGELNFDRLKGWRPADTGAGGDWPLDLAVRLTADQALINDAVARDVVVEIGAEPDCLAAELSQ